MLLDGREWRGSVPHPSADPLLARAVKVAEIRFPGPSPLRVRRPVTNPTDGFP